VSKFFAAVINVVVHVRQVFQLIRVAVLQIAVASKRITERASLPSQMTSIIIAIETSSLWLSGGKLQVKMVYTRYDIMQQILPFVL